MREGVRDSCKEIRREWYQGGKDMSYKYANLYVDEDTYEEWKSLCDEQGMNYGPRVTILMKKDIEALKA